MRWATRSCSALVMSTVLFSAILSAGAVAAASVSGPTTAAEAASPAPLLTLRAQTSWVTPTAPWFTLSLGVGTSAGPAAELHVEVTYYSRINDATHMAQATTATPDENVLTHFDAPVTTSAAGLGVVSCAVVLPDSRAQAPTPAAGTLGVCPPDAPTVPLGCHAGNGTCGDVYPVTVALYRQGSSTSLDRFTTFLTYQEPDVHFKTGGALRVGLVMPVTSHPSSALASPSAADRRAAERLISQVWTYRGIP
jgi:hypothetical protein